MASMKTSSRFLFSSSYPKSLHRHLFGKGTTKHSQPATTRRRLDKIEAFLELMSQERHGTGNGSVVLTLSSKTTLTSEMVRIPLINLAQRQPMLRAVFTPSSSSASPEERYFEIIDGDDVSDMIDFTSSEVKASEWQDVWYEIVSKPKGTGLLWRAVLLKQEFLPESKDFLNTLIFTANHCCGDGVSLARFVPQFLARLNETEEGTLRNSDGMSSLAFLPSFYDLLKNGQATSGWRLLGNHLGMSYLSNLFIKHSVRRILSNQQKKPSLRQFLGPNSEQSLSRRRNHMFVKVFDEGETPNIVKTCRSNGSTVAGALITASHIAICKLMRDRGFVGEDFRLNHTFAVDGRPNCQPAPESEYFGNFALATKFGIPFTHEKVDFWKMAEKNTKRIRRIVNEKTHVTRNMLLFDAFSLKEIEQEVFGPQFTSTAGNQISNMGSLDLGRQSNQYRFKLRDCFLLAASNDTDSTFFHYTATVNGRMSWVIVYDTTQVDTEVAETFANLCFDTFAEISSN